MDDYYFILIDIGENELRSQILRSINKLKLTRACIEVKKPFQHGVPFQIPYSLVFFSEKNPDDYCQEYLGGRLLGQAARHISWFPAGTCFNATTVHGTKRPLADPGMQLKNVSFVVEAVVATC